MGFRMTEQNEEQLAIKVIAKISDLEKQMKRAEAVTTKTYNSMQRNSKFATQRMEQDMARSTTRINQAVAQTSGKVGDLGRAFAVGFNAATIAAGVAMLGLSAAIAQAKQAIDEFGDIADNAAASGLDAEFFQELAYQASLGGVAMDQLSGALATFNKNSGLAVVNKGKMVKALQTLNPELLENIRQAKSQEERIRLVADALDKETDASRKAAIASAAFGDAGAKLANIFSGGAAAIDETARKARELGIIIDNELIAQADELGDSLDTTTKALDVNFKAALIAIGPILVSAAGFAADVARAINLVTDSLRSFENQSNRMLQINQGVTDMQRLENENRILELQNLEKQGQLSLMDRAELADLQAKNAELTKQSALIAGIVNSRNEAASASGAGGGKDGDAGTPPPPPPPATPTRKAAADDAVKQAAAVRDLIENLRIEREQVGMSEVEIAKANALRQTGATATAAQRAEIVQLIEATAAEKAANDQLKSTMDDLKSTTTSFLSTFRQGLMNGESAAASFKNAVLEMANSIMQKLEAMAADKLIDVLFSGVLGGVAGAAGAAGSGGGGVIAAAAKTSVAAGSTAATARSVGSSTARSSAGASDRLDVRVSVDDDGKVKAYVEQNSQKTLNAANRLAAAGLERYRQNQFHNDVQAHAARPRVRGK
jgi:hypothetical protein